MKVHHLRFRIELEPGDPQPNGTIDQISAQIWAAITARAQSTFTVRSLDFIDDGTAAGEVYEVEAAGNEIFT